MSKKSAHWKKGRGKLGIMSPLLGSWEATADSPMGPVKCKRTYAPVLNGNFIQLVARWEFGRKSYEETAIYGVREGAITFWSFTSDGKRSEGTMVAARHIHPEAFAFEAQMPAGLARMIFWPDAQRGFHWAVEAKTTKGWKRFTEHHYRPS